MTTTHNREAYWAQQTERRRQDELDRDLCHQSAARVLNLSYRRIAAAMRGSGVTEPFTAQRAKLIRSGVELAPRWLAALGPAVRQRTAD